MGYLQKMFPGTNFVAAGDTTRTPVEVARALNSKFQNLVMVAGSDRVPAFEQLLNQQNGVDYNFQSIKVVSGGERDPDADDAVGMSGTKLRQAAAADDFETFKQGLPGSIDDAKAQQLMADVKAGMTPTLKAKKAKEDLNTKKSWADYGMPDKEPPKEKVFHGWTEYEKAQKEKQQAANKTDRPVKEKMMPAGTFAGSDKNKLGVAGQWRNKGPKKNSPARQGDLVGGAEESIARENNDLESSPNSIKRGTGSQNYVSRTQAPMGPMEAVKSAAARLQSALQREKERRQSRERLGQELLNPKKPEPKQVPVGEDVENIMDALIDRIIVNEAISNNKR